MSEEARKHYEKYGDNDNYDDEMQIEKIEKEYEKYLKAKEKEILYKPTINKEERK